MRFLARKVTESKWIVSDGVAPTEIPGDGITGDLRTVGNALSLWSMPMSSAIDADDVVLALAAAGDRIDKVEVAWFDEAALLGDGITLLESPGRTAAVRMQGRHVDARAIDHSRLGHLGARVAEALSVGRHVRRTKADVRKMLLDSLKRGELDLTLLKETFRKELTGT